jgi:AcrR family transcriptional regulator
MSRGGPGSGRREQILVAAVALFAEKGFHATSVRDITQQVGMSKAGLYSSFDSKEAILEEIYSSVIDGMLEEVQEIAAQEGRPAEKLRAAMIAQVKGVALRAPELTIFYRERHQFSLDTAQRVTEKRQAYEKLIESIIQEGIAAGDFEPVDVRVLTYGIVGMCAWTYQWFRQGGRLTSDEIGSLYADVIIHGLTRIPETKEENA